MIRVNLANQAARRAERSDRRLILVLIAGLLALLSTALMWNRSLTGRGDGLEIRQQELQAEASRLTALQAQLDEHRREKSQMGARASVARRLLAERREPVLLLNALVASVPDEPVLWLSGFSQKGEQVVIEGNAFEVSSIAGFIASLSERPIFREVGLDYWEETTTSLRFRLTCKIEAP